MAPLYLALSSREREEEPGAISDEEAVETALK